MKSKPVGLVRKALFLLLLQFIFFVVGIFSVVFLPNWIGKVFSTGTGILLVMGVFAGPLLLLRGLIHKYQSNKIAGLILVAFNTIPAAILIAIKVAAKGSM